jgi:hypothetical protein
MSNQDLMLKHLFRNPGICKTCGKEYLKATPSQKYCCKECRPYDEDRNYKNQTKVISIE